MKPFAEELGDRLKHLETLGLRRALTTSRLVDFASNDYLGLARHPQLRNGLIDKLRAPGERPFSAPASRLLRGNTTEHLELEERLARFTGSEAALIFSSGYLANIALLATLVEPRDRVISDEENHASIIDGIRLCRSEKVIIPHLDVGALEAALARPHRRGRTFVVTESLFSMAGDVAPLDAYAELACRYGAELIVDEAHAAGVYGDERGSGLVEHFGVREHTTATVTTFGKGLGLFGACVAAPRIVIDYLLNRARPFIFSTAPAGFFLAAVHTALDLVFEEPERRARVLNLAERLRTALRSGGIDCLGSSGPILPVVIGENEPALDVARRIRAQGFDVRAIRPPSVAAGTARLRLSVHADHTESEIDALAAVLPKALRAAASASRHQAVP